MKTIGFIISHKNGERRRALIPQDIIANVRNPRQLFFEAGYGTSIGISDEEYRSVGCNVVSRAEALTCDVITDVKLGDADYLDEISPNKILYGWAHAVQNIPFTSNILRNNHTVIAWEDIFENGRYIFYRNREVAGEAAIMHAYRYCGKMPYDTKVAILGNGQTAKGALRVLHGLGAEVDVYNRKLEKLFREMMYDYDVLVNCVMWDTNRTDRIIYKDDLKKMKPGTLIIDVSCDRAGAIETSIPTTLENPTYVVDGITHYVVDHTPSLFYKTTSECISEVVCRFIDNMVEESNNTILTKALSIQEGTIIDQRIVEFQNR
jgi:N5-(carboxyethyl)ornithine synthase